MSINIIQLNGQADFLDYSNLESDLKNTLNPTCKKAILTVFNQFPALISTDIRTDLIMTLCLDPVSGNYYRFKRKNDWVYVYNLIIPICYLSHWNESKVIAEDDEILIDGEPYDFKYDLQSLGIGIRNYLANRCGFTKKELVVYPIVFVKNKTIKYNSGGLIIDNDLNWSGINKYILSINSEKIISYRRWKAEYGFDFHQEDIKLVNERASEDSQIGYLTKNKIDRIGKDLSKEKEIHKEVFKHLLLLDGKAGTGKTSELLLLMLKCLKEGQNTKFLTYNHLLVFDIARIVKAYIDRNIWENKSVGLSSVTTLHSFFYRLSISLGVLHLMSEDRAKELKSILSSRMKKVLDELEILLQKNTNVIFSNNIFNSVKELFTNSSRIDVPTKEVAIDFINYLKKQNLSITVNTKTSADNFYEYKCKLLDTVAVNNVFLRDYYNVLKNTFLAINNSSEFYKAFNVRDRLDLLDKIMALTSLKRKDEDLENGLISESTFATRVRRVKGGMRRKSLLLIDEAQDCHELEREILFSVFSPQNLIVSYGGKEQLIRHVSLCNWTINYGKKLPHKRYSTGNKSYRMKKNALSLCNHVASSFRIALDLEPMDSTDWGEVIIDCRIDIKDSDAREVFSSLLLKGSINQCIPYESLLVLLDSHSKSSKISKADPVMLTAKINEFGNIEEHMHTEKLIWKFQGPLGDECLYWDGTIDDKRKNSIPGSQEVRLIYYDSCRGLEAWSVACFNIDDFFIQKRNDHDAEKYLMDDLFYTLEERKSMFAATWALMAMTRAIDTLYIKLNNQETELGKVIMDFAKKNPSSCRVLQ